MQITQIIVIDEHDKITYATNYCHAITEMLFSQACQENNIDLAINQLIMSSQDFMKKHDYQPSDYGFVAPLGTGLHIIDKKHKIIESLSNHDVDVSDFNTINFKLRSLIANPEDAEQKFTDISLIKLIAKNLETDNVDILVNSNDKAFSVKEFFDSTNLETITALMMYPKTRANSLGEIKHYENNVQLYIKPKNMPFAIHQTAKDESDRFFIKLNHFGLKVKEEDLHIWDYYLTVSNLFEAIENVHTFFKLDQEKTQLEKQINPTMSLNTESNKKIKL